jgi:N-acetylmuramoyl-L-alanine amidase
LDIAVRVALDIGHLYKVSHPADRGATYRGYYEADFVYKYVKAAFDLLVKESGIEVYMSDPLKGILVGDYWERRRWVNERFGENDLYLQCHLNSGNGNYALVMCVIGFDYDERVNKVRPVVQDELGEVEKMYGQVLALNTQKFLGIQVKDFDEVKDMVWGLRRGERGYDIVKQFKCPAFVYEPCFIDNTYHFENLKSGAWIEAIAKAIWKSSIEIRDRVSYNG